MRSYQVEVVETGVSRTKSRRKRCLSNRNWSKVALIESRESGVEIDRSIPGQYIIFVEVFYRVLCKLSKSSRWCDDAIGLHFLHS